MNVKHILGSGTAARTSPIHLRLGMPLIVIVGIILISGLWTALIRIGWDLPSFAGATAVQHGALMVSGFLGTLISLERSYALRRRWTYIVPTLSCVGALIILFGFPPVIGRSLILIAGLGLVAVFVVIYRMHPSIDTAVMGVGALLWLIGNALWWTGQPVYHAVPWWAGFLVLTIAGERLELARVLRLTRQTRLLFAGAVTVILVGLTLSLVLFEVGVRVSGVGLIALALWLLRNDIARRTIRKTGLTRYIAACLLPGYAWMAFAGVLWLVDAPMFIGGKLYDAMLHTLFLGFVFSMIFGHAPIIIPALLGVPVVYRSTFYVHLVLLHLSLSLRIFADLGGITLLQRWGGLLNVCAILMFLAITVLSARRAKVPGSAPP